MYCTVPVVIFVMMEAEAARVVVTTVVFLGLEVVLVELEVPVVVAEVVLVVVVAEVVLVELLVLVVEELVALVVEGLVVLAVVVEVVLVEFVVVVVVFVTVVVEVVLVDVVVPDEVEVDILAVEAVVEVAGSIVVLDPFRIENHHSERTSVYKKTPRVKKQTKIGCEKILSYYSYVKKKLRIHNTIFYNLR